MLGIIGGLIVFKDYVSHKQNDDDTVHAMPAGVTQVSI